MVHHGHGHRLGKIALMVIDCKANAQLISLAQLKVYHCSNTAVQSSTRWHQAGFTTTASIQNCSIFAYNCTKVFFCREQQPLHSATAEGVRTRRVSDLETLIVMTRHNTEPEPGHWSHTDSSIQHPTMVNWTLPAKYETDITSLNAAQHPAIPNTELRRRLTVC